VCYFTVLQIACPSWLVLKYEPTVTLANPQTQSTSLTVLFTKEGGLLGEQPWCCHYRTTLSLDLRDHHQAMADDDHQLDVGSVDSTRTLSF
jgi:hypothetical protein